jgi:hypothetical protein
MHSSHDLILLGRLVDERLVDVWNDTATSDGRLHSHGVCVNIGVQGWGVLTAEEQLVRAESHLDQRVELFITTDGELQMPGRDTLDLHGAVTVFDRLETQMSGCSHVEAQCRTQ